VRDQLRELVPIFLTVFHRFRLHLQYYVHRLFVRKHIASSYLPYVDSSSFTVTLLRVVLPGIISPMGASAEFITGTVFAAVMVLLGLGAIWIVRWQTYFLIRRQGKSPDMFL